MGSARCDSCGGGSLLTVSVMLFSKFLVSYAASNWLSQDLEVSSDLGCGETLRSPSQVTCWAFT